MKNNPHGYCVILNNYIFKNPHEVREGSLKDGGKYFFNPITGLVFFSDNYLKELSNISCEEESCPLSSFASRVTGMPVTVEIGNMPLPTLKEA